MRNIQNKLKKQIVLAFYCLNKLIYWSQKFCKFLAFSLEFQSFSRSLEQSFLTVGQKNFGNKLSIPTLKKFCLQNSFMIENVAKFEICLSSNAFFFWVICNQGLTSI